MNKLAVLLVIFLTGCATCPPPPVAKEQLILKVPAEFLKVPDRLKLLDPAAGQK